MALELKPAKLENENPETKRSAPDGLTQRERDHLENARTLAQNTAIREDPDSEVTENRKDSHDKIVAGKIPDDSEGDTSHSHPLITQAKEKLKEFADRFVTDDTGENAIELAKEINKGVDFQAEVGGDLTFGDNVHFKKVDATPEAIQKAIDELPDTLKLKASLDKSDKDAYISKDEFVALMKEVIKDPKDQAALLTGIKTVLEKGLHSNAQTKTLNKLVSTFNNASKDGKVESYVKAANVVSNLLNPDAAALRQDKGVWIHFNYGVGTRANKYTESNYEKSSKESSMLSWEGSKQLLKEKGLKGFITEGLLQSGLASEVKMSSGKFFGLDSYSVEASAVGFSKGEKHNSENANHTKEASAVESAKSSWISGKNFALFATRSHGLMKTSIQHEAGEAPSATTNLVENIYSFGIKTKNYTIGLRTDMSIVKSFSNPFAKLAENPGEITGLPADMSAAGDADKNKTLDVLNALPVKLIFKKND